jgi:poly[(R)-3-hydroxyalkanoate] polymerase subunit PhaC
MQAQPVSMDAAFDRFRAQFAMADILRRAQGDALGAFGLSPTECRYRIVASGSHWRLRDYADQDTSTSLLVVAAPIKRPYIWDLAPSVSAVRHCMRERFHVYLLEWMPASPDNANKGLDEYADAICECIAIVSVESRSTGPFLVGHSLGGTLAAISGALAPGSIRGLVLLGTPLCFRPESTSFRDALVSLVPSPLSEAEPFPGSLLSHMSALAAPGTFIWSRLMDAALSMTDRHALDIHARVERWALDEVALPGKLVHQIVDWLYREDRFCRGALTVRETLLGPSSFSVPTLAVVNVADEVAPLASVAPFIDAMPTGHASIIEYPGEVGVGVQHLGILVGREAHARVWPQIISWLNARSTFASPPEDFKGDAVPEGRG